MSTPSPLPSPFNPNCLSGKVALVTGGGSGIGYAIVEQLLKHGCSTAVILGRRENVLVRSADTLSQTTGKRVLYQSCDVRDANSCVAAVQYTLEKCGRLDILVNGAAGNFLSEAANLKPKGFKTVMEIDTIGTFNMCHAAYPSLAKSRNGCVINISATLSYGATWYQAHASAAKSAIDSLTRTLALEWGRDRIRVNGIAPGPIAGTPGVAKLAPGMDRTVIEEMVAEGIPIGRMGRGFDIGMAVVYLCCDASGGFVTGDTLVVDGGHWLYKPPMVERDMVAQLSRKVEKKSRDITPTRSSKL
eukprot:102964_1